MRIINKTKFIARLIELIIIIITPIVTYKAIVYANTLRGYQAYGGECLLPILALLFIMVIETLLEDKKNRTTATTNNK